MGGPLGREAELVLWLPGDGEAEAGEFRRLCPLGQPGRNRADVTDALGQRGGSGRGRGQEAGSPPHPVDLSRGHLCCWCPVPGGRGAGQCWGAGGGGSLSRPKVTKKEGLGAGGGNSSKGLEDVICNKQITNLAESFLHPDRA